MAQATTISEVIEQTNKNNNLVCSQNYNSKNKFMNSMLDNMEFDNNDMCDNNWFGNISQFHDGINAPNDDVSLSTEHENAEQDLTIMMKYLNFKDSKENIVAIPTSEARVRLFSKLKSESSRLFRISRSEQKVPI